jgi:flagellar biosynthesis GTPase FlhF
MARAMDLKRRVARSIGPFDDPHLAALAHDRAAITCAGRGVARGAPLNFEAAFYRVETAFLHRWEGDVCEALEKGEYDKVYARFLRAGYRAALNIEDGDDGGGDAHVDELVASCVGDAQFFWDDVEDFFLCRAAEIGEEALKGKEDGRDDGGKLLRNRFVEMHRNKSLCPEWRHKNRLEKLRVMTLQKQQQIQTQQQQQQQIQQRQQQVQMQQQQPQQIQTQQQRQQQIHVQHQQQQQNQMKPEQQHVQQQRQIQMQQQQRQQQIQQRQQHFQHQMMMQNQQHRQMMMAQQQQQYLDDDATVQVKQELS